MRSKREESVHNSICMYLNLQYPNVMYITDLSGIKLTIGQAVQAKKQRCKSFKLVDLNILHPNKHYNGLCIEIKKNREVLYTKKGELRNSEHIKAQKKAIEHLNSVGYYATFGCGFEDCKKIIDTYFN